MFDYLNHQQFYLDNLRNIATIAGSLLIPLAIGWSARVRERKRATLDVLRLFTTDAATTLRLRRLFLYRRWKSSGGAEPATNPFESDSELIAESIFILNLCDTVAQELQAGLIDPRMLAHSLGPTLLGVRNVILQRLISEFKMDLGSAYRDFTRMVQAIEHIQARDHVTFVSRIPAVGSAASPTQAATGTPALFVRRRTPP